MGFMDKIKDVLGKGKESVSVDSVKDTAGSVKDKADDLVEEHGDKIPDAVEGAYDKASDAAEKVIPGEDAKGD